MAPITSSSALVATKTLVLTGIKVVGSIRIAFITASLVMSIIAPVSASFCPSLMGSTFVV